MKNNKGRNRSRKKGNLKIKKGKEGGKRNDKTNSIITRHTLSKTK